MAVLSNEKVASGSFALVRIWNTKTGQLLFDLTNILAEIYLNLDVIIFYKIKSAK